MSRLPGSHSLGTAKPLSLPDNTTWEIVPLDMRAADEFSRLRKQKIRVGTQDLKIASIALVHDALLLSANLRDFRQVPGLRVENWLEERAETP